MIAGILISPVVISRANTPPISASGRLIRITALSFTLRNSWYSSRNITTIDMKEVKASVRLAACSAFKLTAVFDMIAFRRSFIRCVHTLLDVVDHAPQVAVGNVGGDHDFPFHVLAADGVRPHGRALRPLHNSAASFVPSCRCRPSGCVSFRHLVPQVILYASR